MCRESMKATTAALAHLANPRFKRPDTDPDEAYDNAEMDVHDRNMELLKAKVDELVFQLKRMNALGACNPIVTPDGNRANVVDGPVQDGGTFTFVNKAVLIRIGRG